MSAQPSEAYPLLDVTMAEPPAPSLELLTEPKPHIGSEEATYLLERNHILSQQAARQALLKSVSELQSLAPGLTIEPVPEQLRSEISELSVTLQALDQTRIDHHYGSYLAEQAIERHELAVVPIVEEPEAVTIVEQSKPTKVKEQPSAPAKIRDPKAIAAFLQASGKFDAPDEYVDENLLSWQDQALCAQSDAETFFPEKGGSTREAKRICANCEVKQDCLEYAIAQGERFGIWGGLSERERRRMLRKLG